MRKKIYNNIGILGGTFDPPHRGHVHISKIALKKFKLKKLLWIVTNQNPLKKKPYLNINERLKLSKNDQGSNVSLDVCKINNNYEISSINLSK